MEIFENIHYSLGSKLEDINIDIKLRQTLSDNTLLYRSYRHSEIYLFGKVFVSICYLFFKDDILEKIEYRFPLEDIDFFKNEINNELPSYNKFVEDPFIKRISFNVFINNIFIGLRQLDKNSFFLSISYKPRLPEIRLGQT